MSARVGLSCRKRTHLVYDFQAKNERLVCMTFEKSVLISACDDNDASVERFERTNERMQQQRLQSLQQCKVCIETHSVALAGAEYSAAKYWRAQDNPASAQSAGLEAQLALHVNVAFAGTNWRVACKQTLARARHTSRLLLAFHVRHKRLQRARYFAADHFDTKSRQSKLSRRQTQVGCNCSTPPFHIIKFNTRHHHIKHIQAHPSTTSINNKFT